MADYGGLGGGNSLRDALNALYPMTGLGNYSTQFPPQTGSPMPSGPVPMPPPRPQMPPQLPPGALGMAAPGVGPPPGLPPGVGMGPPPGAPPGYGPIPGSPQMAGGRFSGVRPGIGPDFAAQLGLRR
jgi:hypothetical protein